MGALTIAFDTTIVGALALPWVILVIHLFFLEGESSIEVLLRWVRRQNQPAVAGVLLFAMTYTLGSAVSRTAQDFFNDNDLHVQFDGRLLRDGVTENRILASVYCDSKKSSLLPAGKENPVLESKINAFQNLKQNDELCQAALNWSVKLQFKAPGDAEKEKQEKIDRALHDRELNLDAQDLFGLQENALMDKGGDYTVRLRQLHDQVMVLRGAAFNGVIAFSLCVFGLGAKFRRDHPHSWVGWAFTPLPLLYGVVGLIAAGHHFFDRVPSDPPYMEFTLLLLAAAGAWLLWRKPKQPSERSAHDKPAIVGKKTSRKSSWLEAHWPTLVVVSAILTAATILGWWSTEVLYAEQVIYSYDSLPSGASGKGAAQ